MSLFAVSCVGSDRPGIVAAVTAVLVDHGCNLEDSSMSILRGHFAMMLVVTGPEALTADALEAALADSAETLDLVVAVRAIDDTVPTRNAGDAWTISVYGSDRPGIVHGFTDMLERAGINIVDLSTRIIGGTDRPVYVMILEVTLPAGVDGVELTSDLVDMASELGVEASAHPSEADIL